MTSWVQDREPEATQVLLTFICVSWCQIFLAMGFKLIYGPWVKNKWLLRSPYNCKWNLCMSRHFEAHVESFRRKLPRCRVSYACLSAVVSQLSYGWSTGSWETEEFLPHGPIKGLGHRPRDNKLFVQRGKYFVCHVCFLEGQSFGVFCKYLMKKLSPWGYLYISLKASKNLAVLPGWVTKQQEEYTLQRKNRKTCDSAKRDKKFLSLGWLENIPCFLEGNKQAELLWSILSVPLVVILVFLLPVLVKPDPGCFPKQLIEVRWALPKQNM